MKILISACLLGSCCRYDGASKAHPLAAALAECHTLVPDRRRSGGETVW